MKRKNLKILLSSIGEEPSDDFGGPRKVIKAMSSAYSPEFHKTELYVLLNDGIRKLEYFNNKEYKPKKIGVADNLVSVKRLFNEKFLFLLRIQYYKLKIYLNVLNKNKNEYDIYHCMFNTMGRYFIDKRKNNAKVIITYHSKGSIVSDFSFLGINKNYGLGKTLYQNERFEMMNADLITFPSIGAMEQMDRDHDFLISSKLNKKVKIIYNGINFENIINFKAKYKNETAKSSQIVLLNVSAHVEQKNINFLIFLINTLVGQGLDILLHQYGSGPLFNDHLVLINDLGLSEKIILHGAVSNSEIYKAMSNADIFIMTSENVIFDIVVLEAMAFGLPVILSADGGNKEVVIDGENGYLAKVKDEREYLLKVKNLINSNDLRSLFSKNGIKTIQNKFTSKKMLEDYLKCYNEVYQITNDML